MFSLSKVGVPAKTFAQSRIPSKPSVGKCNGKFCYNHLSDNGGGGLLRLLADNCNAEPCASLMTDLVEASENMLNAHRNFEGKSLETVPNRDGAEKGKRDTATLSPFFPLAISHAWLSDALVSQQRTFESTPEQSFSFFRLLFPL
ncbi:hypothetical protein CC2G_007643 [Coprinopsis cinerea AmutBmut pab1-1]|nr:hypothetical protein CC2G_007643 [Coprinopsis cinerea AmutBmut pab1-1]